MWQQNVILRQLTENVMNFIEPAIPYLIIGSKKAVEEADRIFGPEIWEMRKKLWEMLCYQDCYELEVAARDIIVAPSDPEVRQVLIQIIIKSFENNLNLVKEVIFFIGNEEVKRIMAENYSIDMEQISSEKNKVFEEFNMLLEEFLAKGGAFQGPEQLEIQSLDINSIDNEITAEGDIIVRRPWKKYTHITLGQKTIVENTPIAARMAQIAEIKVKKQSEEDKRNQALFLLVTKLPSHLKEEFMEKSLDFANKIPYGDLRAQILSNIVPILEGQKRVEFIKRALYSVSDIEDEKERALVLSSLGRQLRGSGKEELIVRIFEFSFFIKYDDAKFQILSSLVPHLYGSEKLKSENETIMGAALELVSGLISQYKKVESYSLLLPYLNEQKKDEIIQKALDLAYNLKDKDMRPEALAVLIPYLDELRQKEILEKALYLAARIQSEYRRAKVICLLTPYLEEPEE
jgi:hypothetical protein